MGKSFGLMATAVGSMSAANVAFTAAGGTGATGSAGPPGATGATGSTSAAEPPGTNGVSPSPKYTASQLSGPGTTTYGPIPLNPGQTVVFDVQLSAFNGNNHINRNATVQLARSTDNSASYQVVYSDTEAVEFQDSFDWSFSDTYTNSTSGQQIVYYNVTSSNSTDISYGLGYMQAR